MAAPAHTIIRNGRLLDIAGHAAPPADLLIAGDTIGAIGAPGLAAPDDADGPQLGGETMGRDVDADGLEPRLVG